MRPFKALIQAFAVPLSYLSTNGVDATFKDTPRDHDRAFTRALELGPQYLPSPAFKTSPLKPYQAFYKATPRDRAHSPTTNRILTILWTNRPMAPSLKLVFPYTMYFLFQGFPIRFHVGQAQMPYDVHSTVLATDSPAFTKLITKPLHAPVALPSISPEDFGTLTKWLYDQVPPVFSTSADLGRLCQLWVSAVALGLWQKANTLMRLGMVVMMPLESACNFGVVRWVFANTPASSPLRDYIVAIFAQRSQPDASFLQGALPGDGDIWSKTAAFMKKLEKARKVFAVGNVPSAWSKDAQGLPVFDFEKAKQLQGRAGGQGQLPLPPFLVWDKQAVDLPDCFFIFPGTAAFEDGLAGALK